MNCRIQGEDSVYRKRLKQVFLSSKTFQVQKLAISKNVTVQLGINFIMQSVLSNVKKLNSADKSSTPLSHESHSRRNILEGATLSVLSQSQKLMADHRLWPWNSLQRLDITYEFEDFLKVTAVLLLVF